MTALSSTLSSSPVTFPLSSSSFSFSSSTSGLLSNTTFSTALPPLLSPSPAPERICPLDGHALRVPLAVLYSLFFVAGLAGNALALWVFLFLHGGKRNSIRVFLINVAVADLVLLACLPFRVLYHALGDRWVLGSVACRLVGNLFYMNMYVSITLLGLISLDRYVRLRGGGRGRGGGGGGGRWLRGGCGRRWSWAACGALWGLALVGLAPMVAAPEGNEQAGRCFQYKQRRGARAKAYVNLALVALFWLVFLMLVVSYGKLARRLLRVSRERPDLPNAHRYGRAARKSFFVLFLFTLCFGPYHAFRPVYVLSQLSEPPPSCAYVQLMDWTNEVMLLFSAFNSCLDPVMYFLLSSSVRKATARALGKRLGQRLAFLRDGASNNSSTTEFQRATTPSHTPRTSVVCLVNNSILAPARSAAVAAAAAPPAGP